MGPGLAEVPRANQISTGESFASPPRDRLFARDISRSTCFVGLLGSCLRIPHPRVHDAEASKQPGGRLGRSGSRAPSAVELASAPVVHDGRSTKACRLAFGRRTEPRNYCDRASVNPMTRARVWREVVRGMTAQGVFGKSMRVSDSAYGAGVPSTVATSSVLEGAIVQAASSSALPSPRGTSVQRLVWYRATLGRCAIDTTVACGSCSVRTV